MQRTTPEEKNQETFSESTYHQQLVAEIADLIHLIERYQRKWLTLDTLPPTTPITPEIVDQFKLPESTVPLFTWCLKMVKTATDDVQFICSFFETRFEKVLATRIPEAQFSPDIFVNYLHHNIAATAKLTKPLNGIIQEYVGDAFSLKQTKILFYHLTSHPLFESTINCFKEKYFKYGCTLRDFSVLTRHNQGNATPFLVHDHLTRFSEQNELLIYAVQQNFFIETSVFCMALFNNNKSFPSELIEPIKNKKDHANQFKFTAWRRTRDWSKSHKFTVTSSPLILAVDASCGSLVESLLEDRNVRKKINEKDSRGLFPLYLAAINTNHGLIRYLLEAKADPTLRYEGDNAHEEASYHMEPVRFGETALECLRRTQQSTMAVFRDVRYENYTITGLKQAENEFRHQHRTEENFNVIQKQERNFSKEQKKTCRTHFSYLFAGLDSYAEIIKAFDVHGKASYTLEQRKFFKSTHTDTKKYLIKIALETILKLSKDKVVPSEVELPKLQAIFTEAKALKKKEINLILEQIYLQIPSLNPSPSLSR